MNRDNGPYRTGASAPTPTEPVRIALVCTNIEADQTGGETVFYVTFTAENTLARTWPSYDRKRAIRFEFTERPPYEVGLKYVMRLPEIG
jgi:hypothetical protein